MKNRMKHDMKNYSRRLLAAVIALAMQCCVVWAAERDNAQWVNPMIGTAISDAPTLWGNYGGTYPGAVSPWGIVQLSPETSVRPEEKGYYYSDDKILYFSCMGHHSGSPNGAAGRLYMTFVRGNVERLPKDYAGRQFSHADEVARPGYYGVRFADGDEVAMTAASHAGIVRYTTVSSASTVMICRGGSIKVVGNAEVHCAMNNTIIKFSAPMRSHTLRGDTLIAHFDTKSPLQVMLSVSANGVAQSAQNAKKQLCGGDFDAVRTKAYADWRRELACVDIDGADDKTMQKFYTAIYHSLLHPINVADVGEKPVYRGYSPWDTFRTLHPLLSLIKPDVQRGIVESLLDEYQHGGMLPKGPMTGLHVIAILLDSYVKGVADGQLKDIYDACEALYGKLHHSEAMQQHLRHGYVDAREEQSVSITAELAYDDWAMMRLGTLLGRTAEAAQYAERVQNYVNLWDAQSLFMLPREGKRFLHGCGELGYQESNKYTASLFAPHNVNHLVNLSGGSKLFAQRLQEAFDGGNIVFDNETILHYPWLFVWAKRPDLAAKYVRSVAQDCYDITPGGIPGNDDLGSMSSWYAFAVMGIMPVCPGTDEYVVVPPLVPSVSIHLADGKTMCITRGGNASGDFMPRPVLNGVAQRRCHITHSELLRGGELTYDWGKAFAAADMQMPYSYNAGAPQFAVAAQGKQPRKVLPNEEVVMPIVLTNSGSDGVCVVALTCKGDTVASKNVYVPANGSACDTLRYRLYAEGKHRLCLADKAFTVKVKSNRSRLMRLECEDIAATPVVKCGTPLQVVATIKNISGKPYKGMVTLRRNSDFAGEVQVALQPGESRKYVYSLDSLPCRMNQLKVLQRTALVKGYCDDVQATVLDVDYVDSMAVDKSGFRNHGSCFGPLVWADRSVATGWGAYIEFPKSVSLMYPYQQFAMLSWVNMSSKNGKGYIDFFTKGDYTLMKMQRGNRLVFFAGGWGRGQCEVAVPDDWFDHWHLVAGVCEAGSIKLYIDGQLMQTIAVDGAIAATEVPWNVGRNAEMPYARFGNIRFRGTRIYAVALTADAIKQIYSEEKK